MKAWPNKSSEPAAVGACRSGISFLRSALAPSSHAPRPHLTQVTFLTHLTPLPAMRRLPLFVIFATFCG